MFLSHQVWITMWSLFFACKHTQTVLSVKLDPGFMVVSRTSRNTPTKTAVSDDRLKATVHNLPFLDWWDHKPGAKASTKQGVI